jgi:hypothetical protein
MSRREGGALKPNNQPDRVKQDEDVFTVRADVAQVKAGRDEFMLLFGAARKEQPNQGELRVELLERVVLSPFAAKRLLVQLHRMIRDYESQFGVLDEAIAIRERLFPTPPLRPPSFRSEQAAQKVKTCFRLLERLHIKPAFERSFKVKEKTLLKNRFLLGFEKDLIQPGPNEKVLDICEQMGMPPDLMAGFLKHLPEASIVGFGFGENEKTCVVRAYLEFGVRYYRAMKSKPHDPDPYLSHLGFKWDVSDNRRGVVTEYICHPAYTTEDMLERLSRDVYGHHGQNPYEIVKGILDLASSKAGNDKFLFLSVHEGSNPRNSFDINVYRANLQLKEIYPFLLDMGRFYSIPDTQLHDVYDPIKTKILGHIAGGIDRSGNDFLTLYFGE